MNDVLAELIEKVRRLRQIERDFVKLNPKKDLRKVDISAFPDMIRLSNEAFDIKCEIETTYPEATIVEIDDPNLRDFWAKMRSGKELESVSLYLLIAENYNKDRSMSDPDRLPDSILDYVDDLDQESAFRFWYDIDSYYEALREVGPMLATRKVPPNVHAYFLEVREVYALGCFIACVALCRAVLEMSLYDRLSELGAVDADNKKVLSFEEVQTLAKEDTLRKFIDLAFYDGLIDGQLRKAAHELTTYANGVLHAKGQRESPKRKDAAKAIADTLAIVERLFG